MSHHACQVPSPHVVLTPTMMKLLGSTKSKITKNENSKNVAHLKSTEPVLVSCSILNNDYKRDVGVLYTKIPNNSFVQLLDMSPENFLFSKTFYL